jgi:Domain of Unknown Function (DUF1080)
MTRWWLCPLIVVAIVSTNPVARAADTIPLFDGKTLEGWKKVGGGATYRVDGESIVGKVGPGPNTFLRTEKTYGDFRLELDVKLEVPGNSGIQFRSHQKPGENGNGRVFGYQCEIDPSPRAWTGGIYDEGRRAWLYPLTGHPAAQAAYKKGKWNHFAIEARGPLLKTWVNQIPCADLLDTADMEGFIALQVHQGKEGRILFKNITLADHGMSRWQPIWNGKTLEGWSASGGGRWSVSNGEIQGSSTATETKHGHLFSPESFGNFALRLKFKALKGDSGVYFRAEEGGKSGVQGIQANIDPEKDMGGLYEIDGRGWLARPKADDVKKVFKPGEWNELSLVALGERIAVFVNGIKTAEVNDETARKKGRLALQLHANQDVGIQFKDIDVLDFDKK